MILILLFTLDYIFSKILWKTYNSTMEASFCGNLLCYFLVLKQFDLAE